MLGTTVKRGSPGKRDNHLGIGIVVGYPCWTLDALSDDGLFAEEAGEVEGNG